MLFFSLTTVTNGGNSLNHFLQASRYDQTSSSNELLFTLEGDAYFWIIVHHIERFLSYKNCIHLKVLKWCGKVGAAQGKGIYTSIDSHSCTWKAADATNLSRGVPLNKFIVSSSSVYLFFKILLFGFQKNRQGSIFTAENAKIILTKQKYAWYEMWNVQIAEKTNLIDAEYYQRGKYINQGLIMH